MNHHSHHEHGHTAASIIDRLTLKLRNLECVSCAEELERNLKANPHVTRVNVNYQSEEVTVEYHSGVLTEAQVRELVEASGRCKCDGEEAEASHVHLARPSMAHLHHSADMAAVTMGTKSDRMQYEMPATGAHAHHEATHKQAMAREGHGG